MNRRKFLCSVPASIGMLAVVGSVRGDEPTLQWVRDEIKRRFPKSTFTAIDDGQPHTVDEFRAIFKTPNYVYTVLATDNFIGCTVCENKGGAKPDGVTLAGDCWRCEQATWKIILRQVGQIEKAGKLDLEGIRMLLYNY